MLIIIVDVRPVRTLGGGAGPLRPKNRQMRFFFVNLRDLHLCNMSSKTFWYVVWTERKLQHCRAYVRLIFCTLL